MCGIEASSTPPSACCSPWTRPSISSSPECLFGIAVGSRQGRPQAAVREALTGGRDALPSAGRKWKASPGRSPVPHPLFPRPALPGCITARRILSSRSSCTPLSFACSVPSFLMRSGSQFCVLNNHLFAITSAGACFAPGFAITNAAFSRQDGLRAYPLLDEVTFTDVGSR